LWKKKKNGRSGIGAEFALAVHQENAADPRDQKEEERWTLGCGYTLVHEIASAGEIRQTYYSSELPTLVMDGWLCRYAILRFPTKASYPSLPWLSGARS